MKKNDVNIWAAISRGALIFILIAATFCGICGIGATFNHIPWFVIAGGLCLLVILLATVWVFGFKSHTDEVVKPPVPEKKPHKEAFDQDNGGPAPKQAFDYDKSKS